MEQKEVQLNVRVSPALREKINATAKRKGLKASDYIARVMAATVESENLAQKPEFLEAWEKLLSQYRSKK